jgi:hypothetical protein
MVEGGVVIYWAGVSLEADREVSRKADKHEL